MAEGTDRLHPLVGEIGVIGAEHLRVAHHLVDGGPARERGDVDPELLLEGDLQVEEGAVGVGGLGDQAGELPELRLLLASRRAEGGRVDRADPLGEDPEAGLAEQLAGAVADLLQVLRAFDEDVCDREGIVERQRRVVAALPDLLGPDPGRDVDQQAAAVTLAVDIAGAMEHLLERGERERDGLVARCRIATDRRIDRAGVLVLDARGRDERPIRALGGEALRLWGRVPQFGSGSAPSSRGRATGGPTESRIIGRAPLGPNAAVTRPRFAFSAICESASRLPQRYFQSVERFYKVFSERSQTLLQLHQGEQQAGD